MTVKRACLGVALAACLSGARANAAPPATAGLVVSASPAFGPDAATGSGWLEIVARIENAGATPQKGHLELQAAPLWSGSAGASDEAPLARVPFYAPPGRSALVQIPVSAAGSSMPQLSLEATSESGARLAKVDVTTSGTAGPLLVDVDQPSRLGVVLRGWPIVAEWNPGASGGGYASSALTTGAPVYDRATGDPLLPDHAAAYAPVTVLLVHTEALVALPAPKLEALLGWVLSGGTLAVVPSRPDDLRNPVLTALTGGAIARGAVPAAIVRLPIVERPATTPSIGSPPTPDDPETVPPPVGMPSVSPHAPSAPRTGPLPTVRERLAGYAGGNLKESRFGATAPYGRGEVHLLAFDPTSSPELEDPWVHSRMIELIARAWDRHASSVFPLGRGEHGMGRLDDVRRALDPNENFRVGLGVSALLLVVYAIVAGPVLFARAQKRGRPLAPLVWAPILSAAAFASIVVIGLAGKGFRGRVRHLTLIETSAGFTRGSERRYRGFFASEARALSVEGRDRGAVLEVAAVDLGTPDRGVLRVERSGVTLGGLTSLPWQTVIVREDGVADVGGGVTVWPVGDGYRITNRTGHALRDLLLHVPGDDVRYVAELGDGATIEANEGRRLHGGSPAPAHHSTTAGVRAVHPLLASELRALVGDRDGERLEKTWGPIEAAAGDVVDWWPEDAPVVLGEMIGVPHDSKDAGLAIESDRVLLRVVGVGGTP